MFSEVEYCQTGGGRCGSSFGNRSCLRLLKTSSSLFCSFKDTFLAGPVTSTVPLLTKRCFCIISVEIWRPARSNFAKHATLSLYDRSVIIQFRITSIWWVAFATIRSCGQHLFPKKTLCSLKSVNIVLLNFHWYGDESLRIVMHWWDVLCPATSW